MMERLVSFILLSGLDSGMHSRVYNARVKTGASKTKLLRSGELARLAGVSTDTLRHYERKGLLASPRRAPNGYREYPASALDRVRLVRSALAVGFTLDELSRILKVREQGGAPCRQVRKLAAAKLAKVELLLSEVTVLRDALQALLEDWDGKLAQTSSNERAGLLEALAASIPMTEEKTSLLTSPWLKRNKKRKENKE
jgi:DNA-binding transcriptional MerR regulator